MIAGGVECMSRAPFVLPKAESAFSRHAEIHDTTIGWRFVKPGCEEKVTRTLLRFVFLPGLRANRGEHENPTLSRQSDGGPQNSHPSGLRAL